jgi:preprotein translocase subunit SecE
VAVRAPRPVPRKPAARAARPLRPAPINIRYFREIISELRKVTWPSRETAINLTIVVTIVSLAVGLFLGGFDYGFSWIVNNLLVQR